MKFFGPPRPERVLLRRNTMYFPGKTGGPPARDLRGDCEGPASDLILRKRDNYFLNCSGERRERREEREETGQRCDSRLIEGTNLAILVRRWDLTHQPDHHQTRQHKANKASSECALFLKES